MIELLKQLVLLTLALVVVAGLALYCYRAFGLWRRRQRHRYAERLLKLCDQITAGNQERRAVNALKRMAQARPAEFLQVFLRYLDVGSLQSSLHESTWQRIVLSRNLVKYLKRCIRANSAWRLSFALSCGIRFNLDTMIGRAIGLLQHEDELVRFMAAEYLLSQRSFEHTEQILRLLAKVEDWFLARYAAYWAQNLDQADQLIALAKKQDAGIELVLHKILKQMPCQAVDQYLHQAARAASSRVREIAAEYLLEQDPHFLIEQQFQLDVLPYIRSLALQACSRVPYDRALIDRLLAHCDDGFDVIKKAAQSSLERLVRNQRKAILYLRRIMEGNPSRSEQRAISQLFEQLDYTYECARDLLIPELKISASLVLMRMAEMGELADMLTFLRNQPQEADVATLLQIITVHAPVSALEQNRDLIERLPPSRRLKLQKLLPEEPPLAPAQKQPRNLRQTRVLTLLLILVTTLPLLLSAARHCDLLHAHAWRELGIRLVINFNQLIVFYVATINTVYLCIAALSLCGLVWYNSRKRAWTLGDYFRRRMVPPVSIVAPCYNEEETIIESVYSLLNLQHPQFEVLVVNDGSTDGTLERLTTVFELEKTTLVYRQLLTTAKVRSTLVSSKYPNLVVIDKVNGGKADALNCGVNLAKYPYFCSIDADTLIDGDSLMQAAAPFAFEHTTCIATGCNIRVINNCDVDFGQIEQCRLPRRWLERFQVLEYMRAFVSGRCGWSFASGLVIISGAFGLFKKKIAFNIGGYSSGHNRRFGTVSEDMELVVKYHRHMVEQKQDYQIIYCPDANGWTQVPSRWSVLRRQRDRWHRGLIEVLLGNLGMLLNPKYRGVGLISYPYYFFFEFLGSWIEGLGYLSVIVAAIVGILNPLVLVLLFIFSVFFSCLISLISLFLEESQGSVYSGKELTVLVLCCLLENLGFRQLTSWWRFGATLNLIFRESTWGNMQRTQFGGQRRSQPATAGEQSLQAGS